uniref:Uncharacterized protein n=1 Tax=Heliothis virescens TaxID=7102 RepID=A0A2A4JAG5_HELVI
MVLSAAQNITGPVLVFTWERHPFLSFDIDLHEYALIRETFAKIRYEDDPLAFGYSRRNSRVSNPVRIAQAANCAGSVSLANLKEYKLPSSSCFQRCGQFFDHITFHHLSKNLPSAFPRLKSLSEDSGRYIVVEASNEEEQDEHGYISRSCAPYRAPRARRPGRPGVRASPPPLLTITAPQEGARRPSKGARGSCPSRQTGACAQRNSRNPHQTAPKEKKGKFKCVKSPLSQLRPV